MTSPELVREVWNRFSTTIGSKRARLYLFGSRAAGNAHERSDFDFIVKRSTSIPPPLWREFMDKVQAIRTLFKIDVVDYSAVDEDFRRVAQKTMREVRNGQVGSTHRR